MMPYETLLVETPDAIATVTLNRPRVHNALNAAMLRELDESIRRRSATILPVRVILLRGAGEKAFAAGADIAELAAVDAADAGAVRRTRAAHLPPHRDAAASPSSPASTATRSAAAANSRWPAPYASPPRPPGLASRRSRLGILPGYGGSQRLPRLIGRGAALKMMLTGQPIDAARSPPHRPCR